jgi:hypothetical protein
MPARVTEAFTLRRLSAKIIGEIESITTLTAAIASGMGDNFRRQPTQGERFGDPRPYSAVVARQKQVHLRHRREVKLSARLNPLPP